MKTFVQNGAPIIEVRDLKVRFRKSLVLKGVSLDIHTGESLVIAGPSGCGKSVFLKAVLGLLPLESGSVRIRGVETVGLSHRRRMDVRTGIGMVFQNSALFDSLTVWQNVGFSLLHHTNLPEGEIREKATEVLLAVGLEGIEDKMPEELSGGMRKRVSIARALVTRPEILFYDEPTTGLDPITSENITQLMQKIHRQFKTTDITVTHDVKLAARIADRIALLEEGLISEIGTFDELRGKRNSPLIKSYLEAFEHPQ